MTKLIGVLAAIAVGFAMAGLTVATWTHHQEPSRGADLQGRFLRWPLTPEQSAYASIKGEHLKEYVEQLAEVTRQSWKPAAQYWGRITGTDADTNTREWVAAKFRELGLRDVRIDPFPLDRPQWFPRRWEVTVVSGNTTIEVSTAQPMRESVGTPAEGLQLPLVWAGLGTAADFAGRDFKGKVALVYSQPLQSSHDHTARAYRSLDRARDAGAAAILMVMGIPGNWRIQMNLVRSTPETPQIGVPVFAVGQEDGEKLRKLIEGPQPALAQIKMDVEMVPNLTSGTVWGYLPGATNEEILIMAHRDGYFDGAGDNASGIAAMLGLIEHFATIPQAQRRRTLRFVAPIGHHHLGRNDVAKMHDDRATLFAKTVVILNAEHVGWTQTYVYGHEVRSTTGIAPLRWSITGSDRLRALTLSAFAEFGMNMLQKEGPPAWGDAYAVHNDAPSISIIQSPDFFHSDRDTPETVPAAGLEMATRAYARIVDEVNKLSRQELMISASSVAPR
jgi:hypothetical protein